MTIPSHNHPLSQPPRSGQCPRCDLPSLAAERLAATSATSVGSVVRGELERRGWTQAALAEVLDRPLQFVNEVCTDRKQLTRESAAQIAAALGGDAMRWLQMQNAYRLSLIDQGDALNPIRLRAALATKATEEET